MPLRLYADECVDARILQGLRRRGIDAVCAAEEGMLGAPDVAHLEKAASLVRVVLTNDQDFLRIVHERHESGGDHPGLLFLLPNTNVGEAIRGISLAAEVLNPAEMQGWIEWIP